MVLNSPLFAKSRMIRSLPSDTSSFQRKKSRWINRRCRTKRSRKTTKWWKTRTNRSKRRRTRMYLGWNMRFTSSTPNSPNPNRSRPFCSKPMTEVPVIEQNRLSSRSTVTSSTPNKTSSSSWASQEETPASYSLSAAHLSKRKTGTSLLMVDDRGLRPAERLHLRQIHIASAHHCERWVSLQSLSRPRRA